MRRREDHGTDILQGFTELLATHRQRALDRAPAIKERLATLEAEEADLRTLLRKLEAADRA